MKAIKLTVTDDRGEDWMEDYEIEDHEDAEKWAESTVQAFNGSLRPGELRRTLKKVDVIAVIEDCDEEDDEYKNRFDGW